MWVETDSLVGKAKAAHASKANLRILLPQSMGSQVFSHLQESGTPSHGTVTWEDKHHHSTSPPSLFSQLFVLSRTPYDLGYPCGHLGSALLAVLLPTSCAFSASSVLGWEAEKCKPCSAIAKTSLCYQHFSAQIPNTAPYLLLGRK